MKKFSFINNPVLRINLGRVFDHIVDLTTILESDLYKKEDLLASSLRKTIVIHTASIIEAFLLWKLKIIINNNKVELSDSWKYIDIKIIYKTKNEEIIAGKRRKKIKKIDALNFMRIIDLCQKYKIINASFAEELHKVREIRNKQHISGLSTIEEKYGKEDLNFVFDVARKTKKIIKN